MPRIRDPEPLLPPRTKKGTEKTPQNGDRGETAGNRERIAECRTEPLMKLAWKKRRGKKRKKKEESEEIEREKERRGKSKQER